MSLAQEMKEGLNAFSTVFNTVKENPYEAWIDWQIRNSPTYIEGKKSNTARQRAIDSGADPASLPAEVRLPKTSEDPGLFARIFGIGSSTPTGGTPPYQPSQMGAYQGGGVISPNDDPNLSPEERRRRMETAMFPPGAPPTAPAPEGEELTAFRQASPGSRAIDTQPPSVEGSPVIPEQNPVREKIVKNIAELGQALKWIDEGGPARAIQTAAGIPQATQPGAPAAPPTAGPAGGSPRMPPQGPPMNQPQPLPAFQQPPGMRADLTPMGGPNPQGEMPAGPPRPQPPVPVNGGPGAAPPVGGQPGGGAGTATPGGYGGGAPAAPPPGGQRLPLNDQRRTQAFDPTADMNDPGNVHATNEGGMASSGMGPPDPSEAQKTWQRAIDGGVHFAKYISRGGESHPHSARDALALNSGVGAMPAQDAARIAQQYSAGGRLSPAESLVRYMVFKYEELNSGGHTALANKTAFEILQRLNLEAAKNADGAIQELKTGNMIGARDAVLRAHDFSPDGKKLAMSKDGTHMIVVDQFTNQPVSPQIPVNQATLLAAAMGMRDGRGLWQHLFQRASMFAGGKADKDAEGRAIRNENNRKRGLLLDRKLAGGGGKGGKPGPSPAFSEFQTALHGKPPAPTSRTTIINQGDGLELDDPEPGGSEE